jgi:hypothetical protein
MLAVAPVSAQEPDDLEDIVDEIPPGDDGDDPEPGDEDPGDDTEFPPDDEAETGEDDPDDVTGEPLGGQFIGSAEAVGLELTLQGDGLIFGKTEATVQSGAVEEGFGCPEGQVACSLAGGAIPFSEEITAHAPGNEGPNADEAGAIPEGPDQLLSGTFAPVEAEASEAPAASADALSGELGITATQTLAEETEGQLQDGLREFSDEVLGPIAEGDDSGTFDRVKESFDLIIDNLDQAPLVTVALGPSAAAADGTEGVSASAAAEGARIVVAPLPEAVEGFPLEGLAVVEVGSASANASTDGESGEADFDPAIARISLLDPTDGSIDEIEIATDEPQTCLPGLEDTPLRICITAGGGDVTQDGPAAAAVASGVRIEALTEDPDADPVEPVAVLALADAVAGVNSADPEPEPEPPAPEPEPDLPRTGPAFMLPAVLLLGIGSASLFAIRRRR